VDIKAANYTDIRQMRTAEKLINFTKSKRFYKSMKKIEDRMELTEGFSLPLSRQEAKGDLEGTVDSVERPF
jgi:type IV secretory pathway VirB4 component